MNINNEDIRKEREKIMGLQNQIQQELNEMGARSIDKCLTILGACKKFCVNDILLS